MTTSNIFIKLQDKEIKINNKEINLLLLNNKYTIERPLYNSRILNNYIKLIKSKYNYIDINELLKFSEIEPYQLENEGHWFTQTQTNRFHKRLSELTGNKEIAKEAGQFTASPEGLGIMRRYLVGLMGPAKLYEQLGKWTKNLTRSSDYITKKLSATSYQIIVIPNDGVNEEPFQCENRLG